MVISTSNVLFGNGDICTATHIVGDCLFECRGHKWSLSDSLPAEVVFADIDDPALFDECVDILDGFVQDCYVDYMVYNHI